MVWQLYSHDMSEIGGDAAASRRPLKPGRLATYLGDPDNVDGYLVRHREAPAGFAFVSDVAGELRKMGDFFVVRAARRQGVGNAVVKELFARYRGDWEIGFQGHNRRAPEFWRRVVSDAVGTDWREERRPVPDKPHIG